MSRVTLTPDQVRTVMNLAHELYDRHGTDCVNRLTSSCRDENIPLDYEDAVRVVEAIRVQEGARNRRRADLRSASERAQAEQREAMRQRPVSWEVRARIAKNNRRRFGIGL